MMYEVIVKGCISIGGRKFIGGKQYDAKELGDVKKLEGLVKKIEEVDDSMSIEELKAFAEGRTVEDLETLLKDEKAGKNRKGAISFLEEKIKGHV